MKQETKCRFGWHNWEKWKKTQIVELSYSSAGIILPNTAIQQLQEIERTCNCCGLIQQKLIKL